MSTRTPAFVLGGTGYVAGELVRLIAGHPHLELKALMSDSQPGEPVAKAFPHLKSSVPQLTFASHEEIAAAITSTPSSALFSAAPHGVSAGLIDGLLTRAERAKVRVRAVDISADFRYSTAKAYEQVYKHEHGAPERIRQFTCAVPEHLAQLATPHVAHPGCFATAILLASVPLLALDLVEPRLFVAGVTGSTGSGRKPIEGTHHPQRNSDLYVYNPLAHRHTYEVAACAQAASGVAAEFAFVPHSGSFARGIHVTVQGALMKPLDSAAIQSALQEYYKGHFFVRVSADAPRVKDVVASNFANLSAVANGKTVAVMCAVDNLTKGAAGGAVQWMNRMLGFDETAGLTAPAPGWT
ncbi:MAG TPA: N-acetyl-gamma-glutamyl-phosphate reductase [Steroidobacteraceae bacterium]|nr:N-acetyl-gamma-glutamyl-phosphate reductase [Steroidobacteraceae bacterium]